MKKTFLLVLLLCIFASANAQFIADFENGTLDGWTQYPSDTWNATSVAARISGNFSLRHAGTGSNTSDYISTPIQPFALDAGTTTWRFRMRYNYNPTGTNKWAIMLMADAAADEWRSGGTYEGDAIGVNQASTITNKILCLYAVHNGTFEELIKTDINWNTDIGTASSTTVAMEVIRSNTGEWIFNIAKSANFDELQPIDTVTDTRYLQANYFGAINTYTSASAGGQKLWLDDVSITSTAFPAKIASLKLANSQMVQIDFTEPLQNEGLQVLEKYVLTGGTITMHPNIVEVKSATQIVLRFSQLLPRGTVTLQVNQLLDKNGNTVTDSKDLSIMYSLYGDVVINEIMAAPSPAVDLPEVNYIELYNRLNVPVSLNGWKMEFTTISTGNTTVGNIGNTTIPAHGYMILCSSSALDDMRAYGNAINVSYISSLTRSGRALSLKDADGILISRVTYSDRWIADETKRSGGWSLEKIDVNNLSETAANWAVSTDERGGTPGTTNSVQASNPDTEPSVLAAFNTIDNQTLQLTFNELFDTTNAQNPLCYSLDNGAGNPDAVTWSKTNPEQITLHFSNPFTKGILYTLTVSAPFSDLAGNVPHELAYTFGDLFIPQLGDIVINEVLFNPYSGGAPFVEIYNRSDKLFDLQQVKLANRNRDNEVASMQSVPQQYLLYPNNYAVFTTNKETVQQFYAVPSPEKMIVLNSFPSYPNAAGCVVLVADNNNIIDEFLYSEKMHSGFIANARGVSLERVNPDRPSSEQANWQSAAQDAGFATPTYRNSQYNTRDNQHGGEFTLPYDVFSPDSDGYNDVLFIDYQLGASGYVATITIYDAYGRLVKELEKKTLLGISGRFAWDGSRHDNHKAAPGAYIVYIELYDLNGNMQRIKKSCALAIRR